MFNKILLNKLRVNEFISKDEFNKLTNSDSKIYRAESPVVDYNFFKENFKNIYLDKPAKSRQWIKNDEENNYIKKVNYLLFLSNNELIEYENSESFISEKNLHPMFFDDGEDIYYEYSKKTLKEFMEQYSNIETLILLESKSANMSNYDNYEGLGSPDADIYNYTFFSMKAKI
ncbi:MAG: hypothetical protein PHN56_02340 [Candidatus Nanoarchaeia archaeon]|nr:hypothetical protein [Candidatus Nanoarchaeia archaeon]